MERSYLPVERELLVFVVLRGRTKQINGGVYSRAPVRVHINCGYADCERIHRRCRKTEAARYLVTYHLIMQLYRESDNRKILKAKVPATDDNTVCWLFTYILVYS